MQPSAIIYKIFNFSIDFIKSLVYYYTNIEKENKKSA